MGFKMYMQSVLFVIAISVTLISGRVFAQSTPPSSPAGMAGVVLKDSEIDSSKVVVGAYVEVTYYKGEKLETVRGYIKAVDSETLTVGRGLWKEQIAFERIQRLIAAESDREIDSLIMRTYMLSAKKDRGRMIKKLGCSVLTGILSSAVGTGILANIGDCRSEEEPLCAFLSVAIGGGIGWVVGVPIGMSWADPHDRFTYSLVGSLIGGAASGALIALNEGFWPSLIICPFVGATIMSEISRKPLEASRFSVGLAPDRREGLFALATLRF